MLRFGKKSAQFLLHRFRLAASIGIPCSCMTQSGELNTFDIWQDLLQGVKGHFQVSRALAPAKQKHLGAYSPEALQLRTHLDDELKVIVQRRSECSHRDVVA